MSTGSFPELKHKRLRVDHPSPSRAEFKERVEVYRAIGKYWEGNFRGLLQDTLENLPGMSRDTEKDDAPSGILHIMDSRKYLGV
jgi:hypothetical protein